MTALLDQLDPYRLIDHAERLLNSGGPDARGRPFEMDLRRAVSASYYALFHAISLHTVTKVFGPSQAAQQHAVRWIDHRNVETASKLVTSYNANPLVGSGWGAEKTAVWELFDETPPNADLVDVCTKFPELMAIRHVADYDRAQRFSKPEARQAVDDAGKAVTDLDLMVAGEVPGISEFLGIVAFSAKRLKDKR